MQAIMATIQGLRTLDNWPESEAKASLLSLRESLSVKKEHLPDLDRMPAEWAERINRTVQYADPLGNPITLFEWCVCCESLERHVLQDYFEDEGNEIRVSTVWMGLNHSWCGGLKIFETMIFGIEDNEDLKDFQERYATLEESEKGHKRAVSMVTEYLENKAKGSSCE